MTSILLIISAICLIISGQIPKFDQIVNDCYCIAYSSPVYKIIMTIAKYSSMFPVYICIYEMGYGEISWFLKMIIWAVLYLVVKIFGTPLFHTIFGFGRGGAITSIIVLILGIATFIIALTI